MTVSLTLNWHSSSSTLLISHFRELVQPLEMMLGCSFFAGREKGADERGLAQIQIHLEKRIQTTQNTSVTDLTRQLCAALAL
jgi:hypothetical protein